ncbi:YIP1 family protein [Halomonas sp. EGI 63088]|uniref:YIP1 family protein n=1 Tax=Halomonas flagellata TaxID=2920385 RepID=A0ABS9RSB0_9GAMM|nr:YIP1 family protein [Halomonas flagellata]MCH4562697.1 YIP1 family protein [Halomonas flagellata]
MNVSTILYLPFSRTAGWKELQQRQVSIPALAWLIVVPLSLLPPVMLYYAGTHYGDDFVPGFADRPWRHITTILFLAELLTFFVMGWLIHSVVHSHEMSISYHDAYLLAALAPLPLWSSSVVLAVPSLLLNALAVLMALCISCSLIYHGLQGLCQRRDDDVTAMAATYTIMAAGGLAWGLLMAIVWAY